MSFPSKNVVLISHKHEISAVIHHDWSLWENIQHRTNLLQIAGRLESCATCSYTQQDSSCVECARWLLCIPFWPKDNYIFLRTAHFFSLSSSSGLPTSFLYHHPFTSTPANHGSTDTSALCEWIGIEQNDGHLIQCTTSWDSTTTRTELSPPWRCKCSNWKYDLEHKVENCPWQQKQQEKEAACDRMWVLSDRGSRPSSNDIMYSCYT